MQSFGENELGSVLVSEKTSVWSASHVVMIAHKPLPEIPLVTAADAQPILKDLDLWDLWPVQLVDGATVRFDGWTVWMILSSPRLDDPNDRHDIACIRLVTRRGDEWCDCGNLLPDGLCPGSREWAGSALYDPATSRLTLFYTASGRRGELSRSFEQRLFQTSGTLTVENGQARVRDWSEPVESFASDDIHYVRTAQHAGVPGMIKGFRDPAHFRDPADGRDYLLFTGSLKASTSQHNGVIGIACATDTQHAHWTILPPLLSADRLNNELERPHVLYRTGLYYLFWSTQNKVFAPDMPKGPTGLYGMVAPALFGPWAPLNGTGLVAANPASEPYQTYSYWVEDTLDVVCFIDLWGLSGRRVADYPALQRSQFGGTPAPVFRIALDGHKSHILPIA